MAELKSSKVHLNVEFIRGFVEALFCEFENSLGPFKSDLYDYGIDCKPSDKNASEWLISIPFAILSDHRSDVFTYFYLCEQDTIDNFRNNVETSVEEIIRSIKTFKDEH